MFRTLRTGKQFSPYSIIESGFSVQTRLEKERQLRGEGNEWGFESDGEDFGDEQSDGKADGKADAPLDHHEDAHQSPPTQVNEEEPHKLGRPNQLRKQRKLLKQREKRNIMRAKAQEAEMASGRQPRKAVIRRHVESGKANRLTATFDSATPHVTSTKWTGLRLNRGPHQSGPLSDRLSEGFQLIDWDGCSPQLIADSSGYVIAVLGGMPRDDNGCDKPTYEHWGRVAKEASQLLCKLRKGNNFTEEQTSHRRGPFIAIDYGISFGGGQKVPSISTSLFKS